MNLKLLIQEYINTEKIDISKAYGITTRQNKDFPFISNNKTIEVDENSYDLLVLEMISPTLNVHSFSQTLMKAKALLSDKGTVVFDFIEETRPMLTVAKKMESWRGHEEEEVFCYTLIDIASALTALGMKITSIEKSGSIGDKQIVAIFAQKN